MVHSSASAQPIRRLTAGLSRLASAERYLFTPDDLRALVVELSDRAFRTLMSRAASQGVLVRICRGLYLYPPALPSHGLLLYHAAARLHADEFTYISLETALSDVGIISQVPINWITVMSSGRSNQISCAEWGTIEFVHTRQRPEALADQLSYDARCRLWRARPQLALRDMRVGRRSLDLIDWSVAGEFV